MAWSTPRTWLVGEVVTASEMNGLRDELAFLHGDAGTVGINDLIASSGLAVNASPHTTVGAAPGPVMQYPFVAATSFLRALYGANLWWEPGDSLFHWGAGDGSNGFQAVLMNNGTIYFVGKNADGGGAGSCDWATLTSTYLKGYFGSNYLSVTNDGVFSGGMRTHRHPYGSNRHIETFDTVVAGVNSQGTKVVTFTDPFAATPVIVGSADWDSANSNSADVTVLSRSTTGASVSVKRVVSGASTNWGVYIWAEGSD